MRRTRWGNEDVEARGEYMSNESGKCGSCVSRRAHSGIMWHGAQQGISHLSPRKRRREAFNDRRLGAEDEL